METGTIVLSMAGRDEGRLFLVVGEPEENFRLIADGKLRLLAKPKCKKLKHLKQVGYSEELAERIKEKKLTDRLLKQKLKLFYEKAE